MSRVQHPQQSFPACRILQKDVLLNPPSEESLPKLNTRNECTAPSILFRWSISQIFTWDSTSLQDLQRRVL